MFYDKDILNLIEDTLNLTSIEDYGIVFNGEIGFYDSDWIKEHMGMEVTPFAVTNLNFNREIFGDYVGRYAMGFLCDVEHRQNYYEIFNQVMETLQSELQVIDNSKCAIFVTSFEVGEDLNSGDGDGKYYFDVTMNFNVRILPQGAYSGIEKVVKLGNEEIIARSLKIEHGKMDFSNIPSTQNGTLDNINKALNNGILVIETYVNSDKIKNLLNVNKIGIKENIEISFGDLQIVKEDFSYDGYLFSNNMEESLVVYLYFSLSGYKNTITIDGLTIPIVSDAINMGVVTEPYRTINSNISKNIYTGRTRAYSFVVAETFNTTQQTVLNKLYANLLNDEEEAPLFEVTITLYGQTPITKTLLLTDIQKSSKDGGRGMITLQFVDGVDL